MKGKSLQSRNRHIIPLLLAALLLLAACSTNKNTARTRWWQSFTARYNTYYNGTLAYIDGSMEKEQGNKDNYTEMIPLYTVGNKASRELGKGNFDKAIEKCQKAIKLHSITRRPEWTKNRRKTPKDLEWLNRREYNPFLWKAWLLMGRSQFYEGDFDGAASTFAYMSRLYQTQPAIYGRARAWLAKCYIEQDWLYDAEDVIRNMRRDSIHWRARKEWDYTYADYYIHAGDYQSAIPYLRKVIKHEMRRKQKAREWFLLGQLYEQTGNKQLAYKAYSRVSRLNPPYELDFNAQIAKTEVMAGSQAKKMIARLRRMARSDNNKDYLDQVYYAIGNIYLAQKDTMHAIYAYETGNEKAARSGIEKGVLLLKLGDLYWDKEKFGDAQRCYGEAIGLLDKERSDYEQLSKRSKVLDELVPYTDAVHLQDSLQNLAQMNEKDRNAAIDRVIAALKKKEKEEKNRQAEANAQAVQQRNSGMNIRNRTQNTTNNTTNKNGLWYFYNQMAVNQGKQQFQKIWGKRENVDNWQRVNKTVVGALNSEEHELTPEQQDSVAKAEAVKDSIEQVMDSAQNDPHKREYYLAQIPFTEEQVDASNLIIMDGLYHSGVIFKDKLDNLPLSEKALTRLAVQYPTYEHMDDVFYHLFLLYSRKGETAIAQTYVDRLKEEYPESQWTALLTDPYFAENARLGVHIEDSLYAATYAAFKADRYAEVEGNTRLSAERFPMGANRDKFIFIGGLGKLNNGDGSGCLEDMNNLVRNYPQSGLAEMAGMIINGVNAGRQLKGGKFDLGDVWERRAVVLADSDSIKAKTFSNERLTPFTFMFVYIPDSVNENQLLYQLARYNFTSYIVRDFDIAIDEDGGLRRMKVSGFRNYDEALQYVRNLYEQKGLVSAIGKSRTYIVSDINLPLLGQQFSYNDYEKFYSEHFAPLKVSTYEWLTEPDEVITRPRRDTELPTETDIDNMLQDGTFIDNGLDISPVDNGTIIEDSQQEGEQAQQGQQGTTIAVPTEQQQPVEEGSGTTITVPAEQQPIEEDGGTTITVPVEQEPIEEDDGTIITVPAEQQKSIEEDCDTTITVPVEPAKRPTEPAKRPTKPVDPVKPVEPDAPTTPAKQTDDAVYFDDDTSLGTGKDKEEDKRKDSYDLEDEYYDLDGF